MKNHRPGHCTWGKDHWEMRRSTRQEKEGGCQPKLHCWVCISPPRVEGESHSLTFTEDTKADLTDHCQVFTLSRPQLQVWLKISRKRDGRTRSEHVEFLWTSAASPEVEGVKSLRDEGLDSLKCLWKGWGNPCLAQSRFKGITWDSVGSPDTSRGRTHFYTWFLRIW